MPPEHGALSLKFTDTTSCHVLARLGKQGALSIPLTTVAIEYTFLIREPFILKYLINYLRWVLPSCYA